MSGVHWTIDDHRALSAPLRAALARDYGHTAAPEHTHAALVSIREDLPQSHTCLVTFAFSFDAGSYTGRAADLEDAIEAECRARLRGLRNAQPLASIVGRRHPL